MFKKPRKIRIGCVYQSKNMKYPEFKLDLYNLDKLTQALYDYGEKYLAGMDLKDVRDAIRNGSIPELKIQIYQPDKSNDYPDPDEVLQVFKLIIQRDEL
jgi:hypothetical protein